MKKVLLIACMSLYAYMGVFAQTVNDVPIDDIDVQYIQIVSNTGPLFSGKTTISIDFGQATPFIGTNGRTVIKDEKGQRMKFNSMIDALNFMTKHGYDFVQAYVLVDGDDSECHYLLKKKGPRTTLQEDLPHRAPPRRPPVQIR